MVTNRFCQLSHTYLTRGWEVQEMAASATKRSWKNRFIYISNWQIKIRNILYIGSTKTVLTNDSYKSNYHFLKSCAGLLCAKRR